MKRPFLPLTILLLISCELIVDVEVPFETKQVTANAFANPDSLWSVQLNLNRNILDEEPFHEINDAQVIIFEGDNPIDTLASVGLGRFRSHDKTPEPGKTYALSVSAPGYNHLHASTSIPFPSPIITVEAYESTSNQNTMLEVRLKDDGTETNYYEMHVNIENEYYDYDEKQMEIRSSTLQLMSEDPAIQDDNDRFVNRIVFKDVLFNGREVDLTFRTAGGGISRHGVIAVTLRTLGEDGYNYLRSALLQDEASGDPFSQPVNVYNNIQNGFGIFAGYSASVYTRSKPKPVILSIDPPTGKAGDHIILTGENFLTSAELGAHVVFPGINNRISAQILQLTPTLIEVIVPEMAVTGRLVVINGRMAVSDSEFVVTD